MLDDHPRWANVPPGFDAVYRCKNHPDREPNPISGKLCAECHAAAVNAYAEEMIRQELIEPLVQRQAQDKTTWAEKLSERKVKPRKESIK